MDGWVWIGGMTLALASAAILVFAGYPLALGTLSLVRPARRPIPPAEFPAVSVVTVVRNGAHLIEAKVANSLAIDYPAGRLEIVVYSDGSTDGTEDLLRRLEGARVRVFGSKLHEGKIAGLNRAVDRCGGEIVVFTDADALVDRGAVRKLVGHFGDPGVGGVSGRAIIGERRGTLDAAQSVYLGLNSRVRLMEARFGSVTSNEGKLYAVRRGLFRTLPEGVSDDLYAALDVIAQRRRFAYEPEAVASIRVPSRNPTHEIERRRRIVAQSLRGIWIQRRLLDPFRSGWFAVGLGINKVLRRLLPFALLALLAGSALLSTRFGWARLLTGAQIAFWLLTSSLGVLGRRIPAGRLSSAAMVVFYATVGQLGTFLGVLDFLRGRRVTRWDPMKSDGKTA